MSGIAAEGLPWSATSPRIVSSPTTRTSVIGLPGPWATALLTSSVTIATRSMRVGAGSDSVKRPRSAWRARQPASVSGVRTRRNSSDLAGPLLAVIGLRKAFRGPLSGKNLARPREERHHAGGSSRDHAACVGGERLVERNDADAHSELAHRLDGLRLLTPRRLHEAAGVCVVSGEELAELLQRGDVVSGALPE